MRSRLADSSWSRVQECIESGRAERVYPRGAGGRMIDCARARTDAENRIEMYNNKSRLWWDVVVVEVM